MIITAIAIVVTIGKTSMGTPLKIFRILGQESISATVNQSALLLLTLNLKGRVKLSLWNGLVYCIIHLYSSLLSNSEVFHNSITQLLAIMLILDYTGKKIHSFPTSMMWSDISQPQQFVQRR